MEGERSAPDATLHPYAASVWAQRGLLRFLGAQREGGAGSLRLVILPRLLVSGRIFRCKHCVVYAQLGIKLGGW